MFKICGEEEMWEETHNDVVTELNKLRKNKETPSLLINKELK